MKYALKTGFRTSPPQVFQRGKKGTYYTRQRIGGRDIWRSLKTTNKKEAERLAYAVWYAQQNKELQDVLLTPAEPLEYALTLHMASESYLNLAESTKTTRKKRWNAFMTRCKERKIEYLQEITHDVALTYVESRGSTNKNFNNTRNDLKQIFTEACNHIKLKNPFEDIPQKSVTRGKKASKDFRAFTDAEIDKILSALVSSKINHKGEWILACNIARFTGLRYKDIALLKWTDIVNNKYIETVPFKTSNANAKAVIINIIPPLRKILKSQEKSSFFILPDLAAEYPKHDKPTNPFLKLLKRLDITGQGHKVGFHSFRSTVATKAAMAGVDLIEFGGVLGHSNKKQTDHYNKAAINLDLSFLSEKVL